MNAPDETIHQPVRLRIMAALTALRASDEGLDFARLKSLTGATDGNLGAHIDHLARAGYVEVAKAFVARRPRTTVKASPAGRAAFDRHVAFLREIIART
ncbi:MAG: transcriptional regulator [Roseiarcus sp.]|jgi:DNA-binding MarR family transcriptional regulator